MLPLPVVIVKHNEHSLNHSFVYLNRRFNDIIGWTLEDIPDKEHWWRTVYPEPDYQKVVESQWELGMESLNENKESFVLMTVNIMTKHNGRIRFNVYTEYKSFLVHGYYAVVFETVTRF